MKNRKRIAVVILFLLCAVCGVIIFANRTPHRPDTDLEFWICDNVDDFDFSGYQPRFGLMGGREYYGTGYYREPMKTVSRPIRSTASYTP